MLAATWNALLRRLEIPVPDRRTQAKSVHCRAQHALPEFWDLPTDEVEFQPKIAGPMPALRVIQGGRSPAPPHLARQPLQSGQHFRLK